MQKQIGGGVLNGRLGFGSRLRAHRERRGITLTSIAESTKIKRSLLEALERGDVSQWPCGLYRRAYMREYACAIGLAPEPLVEEFGQLFPEDGSTEDRARITTESFRLTLAGEPKAVLRAATRARRAAAEAALVLFAAVITAFFTGIAFMTACGAVAVIYYPIAAALTGRTPDPRRLLTLLVRRRPAAEGTQGKVREELARIYVVADQSASALPFVHAVAGEEFPQHHTSH